MKLPKDFALAAGMVGVIGFFLWQQRKHAIAAQRALGAPPAEPSSGELIPDWMRGAGDVAGYDPNKRWWLLRVYWPDYSWRIAQDSGHLWLTEAEAYARLRAMHSWPRTMFTWDGNAVQWKHAGAWSWAGLDTLQKR